MKIIRFYHTPIALFLLMLFSLYTAGCSRTIFTWQEAPIQHLGNLADQPAYIFVKDTSKNPNIALRLTPTSIRQDAIIGKMELIYGEDVKAMLNPPISKEARQQAAYHTYKNTQTRPNHEYIVVSLKPDYFRSLLVHPTDSLDNAGIAKVETYQYDKAASNSNSQILAGLLIIPAALLIALIVKLKDFNIGAIWSQSGH